MKPAIYINFAVASWWFSLIYICLVMHVAVFGSAQMSYHVCVGLRRRLPVSPRETSLIFKHLIQKVCVSCISLNQKTGSQT